MSAQPFRTKWGSIVKNCGKIAISTGPAQPFRTKWGSIVKNWGKIAISTGPIATLSHEMRFDRQKLRKNCDFQGSNRNPFARNEVRSSKTAEKLRFPGVPRNPFARNEVRSSKTKVKLRFQRCPIATLSHEMRFDRQKLRKNCNFQGSRATLSHEMRFDRQKLK